MWSRRAWNNVNLWGPVTKMLGTEETNETYTRLIGVFFSGSEKIGRRRFSR